MLLSIIGCIFGCLEFSNAPNYEYQAQHDFCIGEPGKKTVLTDDKERTPSVCVSYFAANASSLIRATGFDVAKWDADKPAGKERMYQQAKAKCSRNQYGLALILCQMQIFFKEFVSAGG